METETRAAETCKQVEALFPPSLTGDDVSLLLACVLLFACVSLLLARVFLLLAFKLL